MSARYDACVLAGGRASRLGGQDKPGLRVSGRPLIESVAAAVADAGRLIIVGPDRPGLPNAIFRREDPPGGGPVPALRAGLTEVGAPWVALLAADLPFLTAEHVSALLDAAGGRHDGDMTGRPTGGGNVVDGEAVEGGARAGAVLVDDGGREQWLAGVGVRRSSCGRWPAMRAGRCTGCSPRCLRSSYISPGNHGSIATPKMICSVPGAVSRALRAEAREPSGAVKRREREAIAAADEE